LVLFEFKGVMDNKNIPTSKVKNLVIVLLR